jgi:hypothetical protein
MPHLGPLALLVGLAWLAVIGDRMNRSRTMGRTQA